MKFRVGLIQFRARRGAVEENLGKAAELLTGCATRGAELAVLPELFDTGYFWDPGLLRLIEKQHNRTCEWLQVQAERHGMRILAGVGECHRGRFYDSALLVAPGGEVQTYRKTHLFRREREFFSPGERLLVADLGGIKLGVLICVELGFPELARALALQGAELIALPMAFGAARRNIYETASRARAIENGIFLVTANQVGPAPEDEFNFYGHSRVVDPLGIVRLDLGLEEGCAVAELDLELGARCRRGELDEAYPYLRERRPELYRPLAGC